MSDDERAAAKLPDTARCLRCGYLLRGLPEARCPECGTVFDPDRPESYRDPARPTGRYPLVVLDPPSLMVVGTMCVFAVAVAGLRCSVQGALGFYAALGELACIAIVAAVVLLTATLIFLSHLRRRRALRRAGRLDLLVAFNRHILRWRVFTAAIVVTYSALMYPWPAAVRFYLSWPWLSRQADAYLTDRTFRNDPQWVGLWHVQFMQGRGQGFVWFELDNSTGRRFGLMRDTMTPWQARYGPRGSRIWIAPSWYLVRW